MQEPINTFKEEKLSKAKKQFRQVGSGDSIESVNVEDDEQQKKILQGFDEKKDLNEMICKRFCSNFDLEEDIYENISDIQAYTAMFQVHKASKFGTKYGRQSSKLLSIQNDLFDREEFSNEEVELKDGSFAEISFS